jgi:pyridoxine 4-dehydrogenase
MREKTSLGGRFTFAGTSLTVNRIGYGAMQLAGQDGDKRVWGPPRDIPGANRSCWASHVLLRIS